VLGITERKNAMWALRRLRSVRKPRGAFALRQDESSRNARLDESALSKSVAGDIPEPADEVS